MKPFRIPDHQVTLRLWPLLALILLSATTALAQPRFDATHDNTLQLEALVADGVIPAMRRALDDYRDELRSGQQVAVRPLTQQSAERSLLQDVLRSRGYYNARIEYEATTDFSSLDYRIFPGQQFIIRQIDWQWPKSLDSIDLEAQQQLRAGQPLDAQAVLSTRTALQREIQRRACFLRVKVGYELSLDSGASASSLRFYMEPAPEVTLSSIQISGTRTVKPDYAKGLTGLQPGQCFQRPALDQARLNLYESNLFARVQEQISEPDENNQVAVTFAVQERFHRTLSLGGGYATDSGFGVGGEWSHRNLAGRGEQLTLGTQFSQLTQAAFATYAIPPRAARRPRVTFSTRLERRVFASNERAWLWQQGIELEQELWPAWSASAGIDFRTRWTESVNSGDFEQWVALPLSIVRDTRDDPLDPGSGSHWLVGATPNFSLSDTQPDYTLLRTAWRGYWPQTQRLTLAVSGDVSNLMGLGRRLDFSALDATERLYAGGGGSVRGWPYQEVPPATGGRIRLLASLEQRLRISDNWGLVGFADAAWLTPEPTLSAQDDVYGAGLGLRYFTSFAPLRADIASPLPDWGDTLSFYFSIGQAF